MEIFNTPLSRQEVINRLHQEVDNYPSLFSYFLPYSVAWYKGSSTVCGHVEGFSFELRNRNLHLFSLRAKGEVIENKSDKGSLLHIRFRKPKIKDPNDIFTFFLGRYDADRKVITHFCKNWLNAVKVE